MLNQSIVLVDANDIITNYNFISHRSQNITSNKYFSEARDAKR